MAAQRLLPLAERCGYTAHFKRPQFLHSTLMLAKTLPVLLTFKDIGPAKLLSNRLRMAYEARPLSENCQMRMDRESCAGKADARVEEERRTK